MCICSYPCLHIILVSVLSSIFIGLQTGEICLDILKGAWTPAWTLLAVCQAITALMADPAPDSPLNCDAGNLLRAGDLRGYASLARCYTLELASQQWQHH